MDSGWWWTSTVCGLRVVMGSGWWWARLDGRLHSSRSSFGSFQARLSRFQASNIVVDRDYVPRSLDSKHQASSIVVKRGGGSHAPGTGHSPPPANIILSRCYICTMLGWSLMSHTRANAQPHTGGCSTTHGRIQPPHTGESNHTANATTRGECGEERRCD